MTAAEALPSVEALIHKLCTVSSLQTGRNRDELYQHATQHFLTNYHKYDSSKGRLSTWTHNTTRWTLLDYDRKEDLHTARESTNKIQYGYAIDNTTPPNTFLIDLIDGLSKDALTVVHLILNCPPSLQSCISRRGSKRNCIKMLRNYLIGMDWTRLRISKAFYQIKEQLND